MDYIFFLYIQYII